MHQSIVARPRVRAHQKPAANDRRNVSTNAARACGSSDPISRQTAASSSSTLVSGRTPLIEEGLHLNASMGFLHVGTLKEVGLKFDRLIDVRILQKMLRPTGE